MLKSTYTFPEGFWTTWYTELIISKASSLPSRVAWTREEEPLPSVDHSGQDDSVQTATLGKLENKIKNDVIFLIVTFSVFMVVARTIHSTTCRKEPIWFSTTWFDLLFTLFSKAWRQLCKFVSYKTIFYVNASSSSSDMARPMGLLRYCLMLLYR